jgi:pimeloyl-ACP methyl ester carboxylesterase
LTADFRQGLERAEAELFALYGVEPHSRTVRLADPDLRVRVLEAGTGAPVLLVHGSGMCAATWAAVLPHLGDRRVLAVDLPGFGLSDGYRYQRPLREEFAAQSRSLLDALELDRVTIAGTSLGGMWGLCCALAAPERVVSVVSFGVPAVALPGMRGNLFFRLMTTPVVGRLVSRAPAPRSAAAARKAMADAFGPKVTAQAPDAFYDVVRAGMAKPGWGDAMWTHLNLAMRAGRQRMENVLAPAELAGITAPVCFAWGDADVYGPPEIGRRAVEQMRNATLDVVPGGHAPFLDDPEHAAALVHRC